MTAPEWPVLEQGLPREPEPTGTATPAPVPPPGSAEGPTCPGCGRPVDPAAGYCEACGRALVPTRAPAATVPRAGEGSAQTRRLGVRASEVLACLSCGGTVGADGYCQTCGAKAPSPRDHFTAAPAEWVGGVCDRGLKHHRNEDAMALWAEGDRAVLVVCDGVSTSIDSDVASLAAAGRARDLLAARCASSLPGDPLADPRVADPLLAAALVEATAEANQAVIATTAADSTNAASATFAAAVVIGHRIHYANLGDSRVYFLGATGQHLLSLDDSMAQAFIAEGMSREEAESLPRAHAITKWLGRHSVHIVPRTGVLEVTEAGWLVVCSDGLWNYASMPERLAEQVPPGGDPVEVAQRLVAWANSQGGQDNVTVALARVTPAALTEAPATLGSTPTDHEKEQPHHG